MITADEDVKMEDQVLILHYSQAVCLYSFLNNKILLWIVLVSVTNFCAVLWVLKKVNKQ